MAEVRSGQVEVDDIDLTTVCAVLEQHGVDVAWLFGSRATGAARPDSDVDLAVLLPESAGWLVGEAIAADLRPLVGAEVDVVDLRAAPLELQAAVVQSGRVLLSTDEVQRVRFTTEVRSRWFDFAPFQRRLTRAYLASVADRGFARGGP